MIHRPSKLVLNNYVYLIKHKSIILQAMAWAFINLSPVKPTYVNARLLQTVFGNRGTSYSKMLKGKLLIKKSMPRPGASASYLLNKEGLAALMKYVTTDELTIAIRDFNEVTSYSMREVNNTALAKKNASNSCTN